MVVFVRLPDNALPRLAVRRLLDLVVAGNLGQGRGRRRGGRRLEEVREVGGGAGAEGGVVVDIHGGAARAVVLQLVLVLLGRGVLRVRSGASTQLDIRYVQFKCDLKAYFIVNGSAADTLAGRVVYRGCL